MINGLLELLTVRVAVGWVFDDAAPASPVQVRVRAGDATLAEATAGGRSASANVASEPHKFVVKLPQRGSPLRIADLTVEAALLGDARWQVLSRYPPIPAHPSATRPDQLESALAFLDSAGAAAAANGSLTHKDFWSDDRSAAPLAAVDSHPVFILGAARSGTTAITAALTGATRYRGFPEGHVLDVGIRLINGVAGHFQRKDEFLTPQARAAYQLARFPPDRFRRAITALLRGLAAGYTTPYWLDKTPTRTMVASVPLFADAWPNARFIFMKRRAVENLASRARKFSKANFTNNCHDWALIMGDWRKLRPLITGKFIELDQRDLIDDPVGSATSIGQLIGLEQQEILTLERALREERTEVTDASNPIYASFADAGWTTEMIKTFQQICGPEMMAYGYTYDARYRD